MIKILRIPISELFFLGKKRASMGHAQTQILIFLINEKKEITRFPERFTSSKQHKF